MEADLLRYYRVDLYDVLAGRIAPRRVLALLRGLPSESNTMCLLRAHNDGAADPASYLGWGTGNLLTAMLLQHTIFSRYEYAQSVSTTKIPKPKPMDLPGVSSGPKKPTGIAALRAKAAQYAGDH